MSVCPLCQARQCLPFNSQFNEGLELPMTSAILTYHPTICMTSVASEKRPWYGLVDHIIHQDTGAKHGRTANVIAIYYTVHTWCSSRQQFFVAGKCTVCCLSLWYHCNTQNKQRHRRPTSCNNLRCPAISMTDRTMLFTPFALLVNGLPSSPITGNTLHLDRRQHLNK